VVIIILDRVLKYYPPAFLRGLSRFLVIAASSILPLDSRGGISVVSEPLVAYEEVAEKVRKPKV
jgi:hypothetical protein